ncbi:hypothetical protein SB5439_04988 [Klebsiella variicola]|uniref:phage head closure protein n=1 Tax=Klebsiella variicola TaxID=244366 RepID=UPI00109C9E2C|nr:phage head closure protein [Klebsiella variicola]VGQ11726.1 hypothetical protein SB5439_04988 [Klebsiella variicola]
MALSPGRLRHVITFQERKKGVDRFGAPIDRWADVFVNVPAAVEHLSARDLIAASETHYKTSARIIIRYRPGVNASMRIIYRNKIYTINGIVPDLISGLEYLTLPVTEGMDG